MRTARFLAAAAAAGVALGACGDGSDGAPPDDPPAAAATWAPVGDASASGLEEQAARMVCSSLRDATNELVAVANETVTGINQRTPAERKTAILEGFDRAYEVAERHTQAVSELDLPSDLPERDALLSELAEDAGAAVEAIRAEQAAFDDEVATVPDDDVPGRVGQFFTGIEKVMSVMEPSLARYDRAAFELAFLDEPACRHVTQQYRVDS